MVGSIRSLVQIAAPAIALAAAPSAFAYHVEFRENVPVAPYSIPSPIRKEDCRKAVTPYYSDGALWMVQCAIPYTYYPLVTLGTAAVSHVFDPGTPGEFRGAASIRGDGYELKVEFPNQKVEYATALAYLDRMIDYAIARPPAQIVVREEGKARPGETRIPGKVFRQRMRLRFDLKDCERSWIRGDGGSYCQIEVNYSDRVRTIDSGIFHRGNFTAEVNGKNVAMAYDAIVWPSSEKFELRAYGADVTYAEAVAAAVAVPGFRKLLGEEPEYLVLGSKAKPGAVEATAVGREIQFGPNDLDLCVFTNRGSDCYLDDLGYGISAIGDPIESESAVLPMSPKDGKRREAWVTQWPNGVAVTVNHPSSAKGAGSDEQPSAELREAMRDVVTPWLRDSHPIFHLLYFKRVGGGEPSLQAQ